MSQVTDRIPRRGHGKPKARSSRPHLRRYYVAAPLALVLAAWGIYEWVIPRASTAAVTIGAPAPDETITTIDGALASALTVPGAPGDAPALRHVVPDLPGRHGNDGPVPRSA